MNPKYHLLVAAAALSLGACSTDDTCTEPRPENGGYKISFTVSEDPESRTVLDVGDNLRWVPTDKVGIYTVGKNVNPNTLTVADVNQSPVEFIGVLKNIVSPGDKFYAYYPYDAAQSTNPAAVRLSIPVEQKQTKAGVYNGQSHPLVAVPMDFPWERDSYACRMSSVRFRQLGAIVELQLYSSNEALRSESISSVTFVSGTPLAGDFQFDLTAITIDGEIPISGYASKEVTTLLEEPAAIPAAGGEAARVYLTIAPGQYTGKIVVNTDVAQYTFPLAAAITFDRAVIKGLPADLAKAERKVPSPDDPVSENDPINFEDPIVKEICIENWDTNSDGELSYKEASAVTSIGSQFQIAQKTLIRSFNELQYFTGLQSIGNSAFSGCSGLTNITIPGGATKIDQSAFSGCSSLTSINIPDGVTAIESGAFDGCSSLTSVNIPDGVTEIKNSTFYGCRSLTSIHLPDGMTTIGRGAFRDCSNLTSINIPVKVTNIGNSAFSGCSSLTSLHIPDGVTEIGSDVFYGCSSLTSVNIPDGVTKIGSYAFYGCSGLTSINIPNGVTAIEDHAFYDCRSLTSISIPQKVSSIGRRAFVGCSSLSAFYGKYASADNRCLIQYGALLAFAPAGRTEYTIPDEVLKIEEYTFYSCYNLTSITIPDKVTEIGQYAFRSCTSLTSINIPDGVTAIGIFTFDNCQSLTSITIPDGVTTIGMNAFSYCRSLASVYCKPANPPTIVHDTFTGTPSSMKIYVPTASVDAYKTANYWKGYASQILADNN